MARKPSAEERSEEAISKIVAIVNRASQATTERGFEDVLEEARGVAPDVLQEHRASLNAWIERTRREAFDRIGRARSDESTRQWNAAANSLGWAELYPSGPEDVRAFLESVKPIMGSPELRARVEAVAARGGGRRG